MNRHTPIAVVVIAACGLVVWTFRFGMVRPPVPGGEVSLAVHPVADDAKDRAANRVDPAVKGYGSIFGQIVLVGEVPVLPALAHARDIKPADRATCTQGDIPD